MTASLPDATMPMASHDPQTVRSEAKRRATAAARATDGMPIALFEKDGIVHAVFSGSVTGKEFETMGAELEELEATMPRAPNRFADLSRLTCPAAVTFADVLALANRRRALRFPNSSKTAILARHPIAIAFVKMFQELTDHPQITIELFSDRDVALKWLAE